ncbi:hypothetical protein E2562_018258 [Oryza meyeriana var. granulata]|uniref:Uncharacterized protein n=1 Tax=Oryza meyeriana var. granulata TaxID=110450 RepID=A0A6G1CR95_9ORYZ|nr:hypothetical protein E2562_018258 [Oryza meyeriana var. granulata]
MTSAARQATRAPSMQAATEKLLNMHAKAPSPNAAGKQPVLDDGIFLAEACSLDDALQISVPPRAHKALPGNPPANVVDEIEAALRKLELMAAAASKPELSPPGAAPATGLRDAPRIPGRSPRVCQRRPAGRDGRPGRGDYVDGLQADRLTGLQGRPAFAGLSITGGLKLVGASFDDVLAEYMVMFKGSLPPHVIAALTAIFEIDFDNADEVQQPTEEALLGLVGDGVADLAEEVDDAAA